MHFKLFAFFICGLMSMQSTAQDTSRMMKRDLLVGLSFRPLGHRGLGFHQFSRLTPELQTLFFFSDHLAIGPNLRVSFSNDVLLNTSLADLSIQARHWIGGGRRLTFIDLRAGRGFIANRWKDPVKGEENNNNTMFAFGLGRAQPVTIDRRLYLEAEVFYEFRKSDLGSWFDSFKFDVGIKYLFSAARTVRNE